MACLLCVPQSQHFLGSSEPGALATGGTAPVADAPGSERIISVKRPRAAKHSGDPTHRGGVRFSWHGRRGAWQSGVRAVQGARLHTVRTRGLLASRGGPSGIHALQGRDSCCPTWTARSACGGFLHAEREGHDGADRTDVHRPWASQERLRVQEPSSELGSGTGVEPATARVSLVLFPFELTTR